MAFFQDPPALGNTFETDRVLQSYFARALPEEAVRSITPALTELGALAGGELYRLQLEDRPNEPRLVPYDAWGHRVDRIELTKLWERMRTIAVQYGLVATGYEKKLGAHSRVHQFALAYVVDASSDVYSCPLAMADGAAKTLVSHGRSPLFEHALEHLLSRDPATAWTSGQWMTERTGGSDVGLSETIAKPAEGGRFRLYGTKWFTSASTSEMALTLARPEGNPEGGRGLALFYVETKENGVPNGITVNRLKDKLGTRKVPTAELTLDGTLATPVAGLTNGTRNISPMLNVTRIWNAIGAISGMRRGLSLARDYAARRVQFGGKLADKPLHLDTLAGLSAEFEAAFHLTFRVIELLGADEAGELDENKKKVFRLLVPIMKLVTAKQGVEVASEILECFGGAGYVEDTGLPRILRDAQVLPIWEGTTNVLSLDVLRVLAKERSLAELAAEVKDLAETPRDGRLIALGNRAMDAVAHAEAWVASAMTGDPSAIEAGARRLALTLGRAMQLALLVRHAAFALEREGDVRPLLAAQRFAAHGVDRVRDEGSLENARALALELPLRG